MLSFSIANFLNMLSSLLDICSKSIFFLLNKELAESIFFKKLVEIVNSFLEYESKACCKYELSIFLVNIIASLYSGSVSFIFSISFFAILNPLLNNNLQLNYNDYYKKS